MSKKFKLSERDVKIAILNAVDVLKSVCNEKEFKQPKIYEIRITNAKSYWANIRKEHGDGFRIHVSRLIELITDTSLAKRRLEETIIHELIHTMPGRMNHGPKFKMICERVNRKYFDRGYNICTKTSSADYGVKIEDRPKQRYIITCPDCGKVYYYSRKPKYNISMYNCSCGKSHLQIKEI